MLLVMTTVVLGLLTAAAAPEARAWTLRTSLGAGAVAPDQDLANYRWDTRPASTVALQAVAGRDRWGAGLRLSRWSVTQGTGLGEGFTDPTVRSTQFEVVGQVRLASLAGFQLWATGLGGLMDLAYSPDRLTIPGSGPGGDVTVVFEAISEPVLGAGLELRRNFAGRWVASLAAEGSRFGLDTRHRVGDEIVARRESFTNWGLRLQVGWVLDLG